jgi:hypothetical protein
LAAYTHDDQARKYLLRAFCFADNGFEHSDFEGVLGLILEEICISKRRVFWKMCWKITIKNGI